MSGIERGGRVSLNLNLAEDVIGEESEPPITGTEEPPKKEPHPVNIDIDDAQIDEAKDDAFRESPGPVRAPKRRKKA